MEDVTHLKGDENLKAQNDFLKMKMMPEHGAQFGSIDLAVCNSAGILFILNNSVSKCFAVIGFQYCLLKPFSFST